MDAQKPNRDRQEAMQLVRDLSQAFSDDDAALSAYFSSVNEDDIIPQRSARNDFSHRLELARTTPTVVTVRARGDNPGGTFLIIEATKARQMARSSEKESVKETIIDRMRSLRAEMSIDLPKLKLDQSQRSRSSVPRISRAVRDKG